MNKNEKKRITSKLEIKIDLNKKYENQFGKHSDVVIDVTLTSSLRLETSNTFDIPRRDVGFV